MLRSPSLDKNCKKSRRNKAEDFCSLLDKSRRIAAEINGLPDSINKTGKDLEYLFPNTSTSPFKAANVIFSEPTLVNDRDI